MKRTVYLILLVILSVPGHLFAQNEANIELFSPQGIVKNVRQVRARFSEAMVPFGDPRVMESPFSIACPYTGNARWADSRNWMYDFDEDLPAGAECRFTLIPELKTLSGNIVSGTREFVFSTGGPKIVSSRPFQGSSSVNEDQIFILSLDGEADEKSVLENAYFIVQGLAARIGIRIIDGDDREAIIRSQFSYRKDLQEQYLENKDRYPLIQARQLFPSGTDIYLVWGHSVASKSGVTADDDQILPFKVRTPFTATFTCTRENYEADCVPVSDMRINFSAPVPWEAVSGAVLKGADDRQWEPHDPSEDDNVDIEHRLVYNIQFKGPFPEQTTFTVEMPQGIRDESGRELENADRFPLRVRTDEYPPLAKFAADFGIIELNADPVLPVTLRNIEPEMPASMLYMKVEDPARASAGSDTIEGDIQGSVLRVPAGDAHAMLAWIEGVERRNWRLRGTPILPASSNFIQKFTIPKLHSSRDFEVVGIPLEEPGFYVVELESRILGDSLLQPKTGLEDPNPMYVSTTALVTNMSVHFKWGMDTSLVWVTTLDKAEPVKEAEVRVQDCAGNTLWQGRTDSDGIALADGLPDPSSVRRCDYNRYGSGVLVSARLEDDMAFVHSNWDDGIEPWRFRLPTDWRRDDSIAHTIFDRPLFRAGETVHMKHILRRHATEGITLMDRSDVGDSMTIRHIGSNQDYKIPLTWDVDDISESSWDIPKDAKLGTYRVLLEKSRESEFFPTSGSFQVQEYRVPLMKGSIRAPAEPLVAASSLPLDLMVQYLSGGGAGNLPIRLRWGVREKPATIFPDFSGFTFSTGRVREGIYSNESVSTTQLEINSVDLTLDTSGAVRHTVTDLPAVEKPMEILTELEFRDPNGEVQTISSRFPLLPAGRHIGIKPDSWAASKDSLKFQVAVVDLRGNPIPDAPVKVEMLVRKNYSYRKRLVGGFYAYENKNETEKIGALCEGKTDSKGLLFCEQPSLRSGNVILQAITTDDAGREIVTYRNVWVVGEDTWWFNVEDEDRMDVIPEKKNYEPGETAKLQVRMPFREATVLISVEREGVGETYVRKLSGQAPVIEVPIEGHHAPNVFISVLALRGRIGDVQPTAMVDLGRPSWKLGIAEINVGWKAHELKVRVQTDKSTYKVRDKARVSISVSTADGKPLPAGAEVALAAVDEGLLELKPNESWKLLDAMMSRRSYGVTTSTAQMHVIGKRHFGLKALPQGGGGGRQATRELFDTLLLWEGRVKLDENGEASVEVPLNDSLTSFRIAAIAHASSGLFGTGTTSIRSTQDLALFSGIPPVVRQGDVSRSEFTLRNATQKSLNVKVEARVREIPDELKTLEVSLLPEQSRTVGWDIRVPFDTPSLHYELEASADDGIRDSLNVSQNVVPAVPVRVYQSTLAQLDGSIQMDVRQPVDALSGRGGIDVVLRPTLLDGLSGVIRYMETYPYNCLEQKISRAIVSRDVDEWNSLMSKLPAYFDSDGLVKYFPVMRQGSEVLTSYLLSIADEAGWTVPADLRTQMLSGLRGFVEGRVQRRSSLPTADLSIRKIAAIEALSRYRDAIPPARGIPTRPVKRQQQENVIAELLSAITIEPNLWPTSAVIDWANILLRSPEIDDRDLNLTQADQILRSRLNFQGTTMGFSTEEGDCLWWLMISIDGNALRLLLNKMEDPAWERDIPRVVQGVVRRQRKGRWSTTTANAWGVLAMEKFSRLFENVPVTGETKVSLDGEDRTLEWSGSAGGDTLAFDWPEGQGSLEVAMEGTGKPWTTVTSYAAIPLKEPLSTGFKIRKSYEAIERQAEGAWTKGDTVRVRLEIESQADMTWVVVDDPIPAGASIVGTGLGRDSQMLRKGETRRGYTFPVYEERSFEAYRAYYEYVPKGSWMIEYTMRLNNEGVMQMPATRVEALYAPEMFGEIPNDPVRIQ